MFFDRFLKGMAFAVMVLVTSSPQSLAGDEVRAGKLRLQQPWARATIGTSRPGAAYLTIINNDKADEKLLSVATPVAGRAEFHLSTMQDGIMKMTPVGFIIVKAGKTVKLAPGGLHVMLMELKEPLKRGDRFPLTLSFQQAGKVTVKVRVAGPGASKPPQ